jgi:hypothetical protein
MSRVSRVTVAKHKYLATIIELFFMSNPKINGVQRQFGGYLRIDTPYQNKLARIDCLQRAIASLNQQRNELFLIGKEGFIGITSCSQCPLFFLHNLVVLVPLSIDIWGQRVHPLTLVQ